MKIKVLIKSLFIIGLSISMTMGGLLKSDNLNVRNDKDSVIKNGNIFSDKDSSKEVDILPSDSSINISNDNNTNKVNKLEETVLNYNKIYKFNDKGEAIKEIQKKLNKFGYKLVVDGVYGDGTSFAVSNFQRTAGLSDDGTVGPDTLKKLDLNVTDAMMFKPKIDSNVNDNGIADKEESFINSQNINSNTDYCIFVDYSKLKVYVFSGKINNWKLIKSMPCSMGAPSTPTITGHFEIGSRGNVFRVSDSVVCKYYTQISGNYLFHTVLLDNNGKVVDGRLGLKISHGCIRLAVENAKYIYENIPASTAVWIK